MNVGGDTPIERDDMRETSAVGLKASDDGVVRALQNPDEASFETARRLALDADEHAVAVHRLCQVRRWNVDVVPLPWLRSVWHDEAETGRIGVQASGNEVRCIGQREPVAAHLRNVARGDQRLEQALEGDALFARNLQQARQLTRRDRVVDPLLKEFENLIC